MNRFFVRPEALRGDRVTLGADQARQVSRVLRLGVGDRIVALLDGQELEVTLDRVGRAEASGLVTARRPCAAEPSVRLTLALPLLRGDRSEEVLEAVSQLGAAGIVPFTSERSVARELSAQRRARWERIARESAETARRGRVPAVEPLARWPELFDRLEAPVVVPWEEETGPTMWGALDPTATQLSLVIGPEGGLTAEEIALARARGARTVTLGPRNLRSETAAIAAVAIALAVARA